MKNTLKAVLAVMSLTLVLAACGPKGESTEATDSTKMETPAPEAPASDSTADSTSTM
jgi:predicted small lipoprotein YifL